MKNALAITDAADQQEKFIKNIQEDEKFTRSSNDFLLLNFISSAIVSRVF